MLFGDVCNYVVIFLHYFFVFRGVLVVQWGVDVACEWCSMCVGDGDVQ